MKKYLSIALVSLCRKAGINDKLANMGKLTFVLISIFLILSGCENKAGQPEWQKTYDDPAVVRKMFVDPPLFYAPHAFWFWDDTLDLALVASMAEEMTRQRLNPGYAHGRHSGSPDDTTLPSLPADQWMSDLWLDCFAQGVNKAKAAGMTLGYCDDYWWPSGQAAGRVLKEHPELRAQYLKWDRTILKGNTQGRLPASKFTVAGRLENGRLDAATLRVIGEGKAFEWTAPDGEWVVYSYQVDYHSGFDNGEVNYLDPRLTKVFISMVHEKYAARFGDKLGSSIPGCFIDNEGDFGWQMAWSEYLPQRYTEMKNGDMRVTLPLLTEKDKDGLFAKARFDWYDVVADVYNNQFFKPVIEWLKAHDMYYISNLWEETLMFQAQAMGDFMHIQRLATMPGTDCLQMKSQLVHDFKESQSVCEFEDKPFMSEIMGVAGWEQTPAQMKMTVNSITAFGITHIVPHGIFLNRELGTIPYPADWFTENPYWKHLHLWTDFVRRASFVNRQGKLVADVLLVNPIESVWALTESYFSSEYTAKWDSAILNIEDTYSGIMKALTGNNIDYLTADRHYMKTGRVKTGDKTRYEINGFEFSAIVLPPMFIIDQEEAQKILEFAQKGGLVYLIGKLPQGSPEKGANDPKVKKMMEELKNLPSVKDLGNGPAKLAGLVKDLNEKIAPQLVIEGTKDYLFTAHRKIGDHDFYWIANNNENAAACNIGFRDGGGLAEIWNCENGQITPVGYLEKNGRKTISLWFHPYEAYWVVFNPREKAINVKNDNAGEGKMFALDGEWTVSLADAGIVRFTSAKVFKEGNNNKAMNQAFLEAGYDDTEWPFENFIKTGTELYSWFTPMAISTIEESVVYYRFTFQLPGAPSRSVINVCGDDEELIWVNGTALAPGAFAKSYNRTDAYDITGYLKPGKNVIAVELKNGLGLATLLVQGWYRLPSGEVKLLALNKTWKQSMQQFENWEKADYNDAAWKRVVLADQENEATRKSMSQDPLTMETPGDFDLSHGNIYWRAMLPPGAQKVVFPKGFEKALLFFDGKQAEIDSLEAVVPLGARTMCFVWPAGKEQFVTTHPVSIVCSGSARSVLQPWYNQGLLQYTGYVDYETAFNLERTDQKTMLDLGDVKYMAEIWVNGKWAGERLWPPFTYDISGFVTKGENTLKVRVGNLMVNRMWLEDDLGKLRLWGWTGIPKFENYNAGIYGPVRMTQLD